MIAGQLVLQPRSIGVDPYTNCEMMYDNMNVCLKLSLTALVGIFWNFNQIFADTAEILNQKTRKLIVYS